MILARGGSGSGPVPADVWWHFVPSQAVTGPRLLRVPKTIVQDDL
jgi:hypothetical protein